MCFLTIDIYTKNQAPAEMREPFHCYAPGCVGSYIQAQITRLCGIVHSGSDRKKCSPEPNKSMCFTVRRGSIQAQIEKSYFLSLNIYFKGC